MEDKQDESPPVPPRVYLPTKAPTVRYVPNSGWSRYKLAVQSLVPFRRTCGWVPVIFLFYAEHTKWEKFWAVLS